MPTPTYTPLAEITLTGTDAEVNFTSISGIYRDLILIWNGQSTGSVGVRVNGDTAQNYPVVYTQDAGSGALTNQTALLTSVSGWSSNTDSMFKMDFMDYSATDKHKSVLTRSGVNTGSLQVHMMASRWASTSAITSLRVFTYSGSMNAGTTISLYGVAA